MHYLVKTPWWVKRLYPRRCWSIGGRANSIYLTFDDGPHPSITPFVLDQLKKYDAKASFFCIGKNVEANPAIYKRMVDEGHRAGNHTQQHLNGWHTKTIPYLEDIREAKKYIHSPLFRPPYGRMRSAQARRIGEVLENARVIMWDVLSGDFDRTLSREKCYENVIRHAGSGSIIVFHDSEKAFPRLEFVLPRVLEYFTEKGYMFRAIE